MKTSTSKCIRKVMITSLFCGIVANSIIQKPYVSLADDTTSKYEEEDILLVEQYVSSVNEKEYADIGNLCVDDYNIFWQEFIQDETNTSQNIGVFNVKSINSFEVYNTDSSYTSEANDVNYTNEHSYLLELECDVNEPDVCFMDGLNYYNLVIVTENDERKILEFSVASEDYAESITGEATNNYNQRMELLCNENNTGTKSIYNTLNGDAQILADYTPYILASYTYPSTIRVKKTGGSVYTIDFKKYCYVVSATEFNCGTDGNANINIEALKAFSLCVRNVGWYRCLHPYNANAGYDVTDNESTQAYNWDYANNVTTLFPNNISAMDSVWSVIMLDKNKNLFHADYRSGKYNADKSTGESYFYQNGSNYLATVKGYDYKTILHYYYDDAQGSKISAGPIIICSSHASSGSYKYNSTSHWKVCDTCGKPINMTGHNYIDSGTYKTCRICGYKTTNTSVSNIEEAIFHEK